MLGEERPAGRSGAVVTRGVRPVGGCLCRAGRATRVVIAATAAGGTGGPVAGVEVVGVGVGVVLQVVVGVVVEGGLGRDGGCRA